MSKQINMTCIMCPMGCQLVVEKSKKEIRVSGNTCVRGEQYAKEEVVCPKRILTALVKTQKGVLPVKTTIAIPKEKMFDVVKEINSIKIKKGKMGDIVIKNVLNLGADIVVTGNEVDYQI